MILKIYREINVSKPNSMGSIEKILLTMALSIIVIYIFTSIDDDESEDIVLSKTELLIENINKEIDRIPHYSFNEKFDAYKELLQLDPDNTDYKKALEDYKNKKSKIKVISCGRKTVTLDTTNRILQIDHGDGTIHSGNNIEENWKYNGNSIKNKWMESQISCNPYKSKSREEAIEYNSSKHLNDPKSHGMSNNEAELMRVYLKKILTEENKCYLIQDVNRSTKRNNMFFIDCFTKSRYHIRKWVSLSELEDVSRNLE